MGYCIDLLLASIELVNVIREFRPTAVLCPHPTEFGRQDHMDTGRYAVAAVDYARADGFPSPLAPHTVSDVFMFYYEDFRSEQFMGAPRHSPEIAVDITDVIEKKRAAMAVFAGTQRKAGEDYNKKLDAFFSGVDGGMGYTVERAAELVRRLEDVGLYWLEEPLAADDYEGYRRLGDLVPVKLAAGEADSGLKPFRALAEEGGVDVLQPDLARCGGFTVACRIGELQRVGWKGNETNGVFLVVAQD